MNSEGRPRGFAHIEFANREIAVATVDSTSRKPIRLAGRNLHVDFATGVRDRTRILFYARRTRNQFFGNSSNDYLQDSTGFPNRKRRRFVKRTWLEQRAVPVDDDEESRRLNGILTDYQERCRHWAFSPNRLRDLDSRSLWRS
jgi:RNA recognition motif-containing protein